VGRFQFLHALVPGQPPRSHWWHPGCCRCLLKGCERWFLPQRPQACYCSPACQDAARRWRRWLASQRYRATPNGQQRRREQAQRYRDRLRQRATVPDPGPPTPHGEPATAASATPSPLTTDPPHALSAPGVGQRPAEIPEKIPGWPCHRPGCYVLFLPSVRCPDQKFCSGLCRQALRRVRQRQARLRLRRRRGGRPLCRTHRGPPQACSVMSSRIEDARL